MSSEDGANQTTFVRTCTACQVSKNINEFHVINTKTNRRSPWCKVCRSRYARNAYANNPQWAESIQRSRERLADRNAAFISEFLVGKRCDCGQPATTIAPIISRLGKEGRAIGTIAKKLESTFLACDQCFNTPATKKALLAAYRRKKT